MSSSLPINQSDLITDIQCTRWDIASNDIIGQISVFVAYSMPCQPRQPIMLEIYSFEFGAADEEIRFFLIVTIICKTVLVSSQQQGQDRGRIFTMSTSAATSCDEA